MSKMEPQTMDLLSQLLKRKPQERISAEKALSHPYFSNWPGQSQMIDENMES